MNRLLIVYGVIIVTSVLFFSCTKEYITHVAPSKTIIYERNESQWIGIRNKKYIDLPIRELTDYFTKQGTVIVHMSIDDKNSYVALPAVCDAVSFYYNYNDGNIRIYAEDPIMESRINVPLPSKAIFKITLSDSELID